MAGITLDTATLINQERRDRGMSAGTVLQSRLIKTMSHPLRLTPEMERFAEEQVHAGNFKSVDEVARAAFSLLRENARRRDIVRAELSGLFEEMDAGKGIPTTDEDFARMVHERAAKLSGQ